MYLLQPLARQDEFRDCLRIVEVATFSSAHHISISSTFLLYSFFTALIVQYSLNQASIVPSLHQIPPFEHRTSPLFHQQHDWLNHRCRHPRGSGPRQSHHHEPLPQPVYVWSIPSAGSAHTNNLPIPPGGRYEEAWRHGTSEQPGIALKISTEVDGIYKGMDEINFAYSIERSNKSEVWVDLSPVRGKPFDSLAFHSCHGMHQSSHVQPGKCKATDDIELVLCDDTPLKHITTTYQASSKYNYQATTTITITEHATVTELAREEPPACRETANTLRKHTMAGDQEPGLFDLLDEILGFDDDVMMKCVRKNCSPNWPSDVETL